jgi:magnesium chelatase subunit H
MAHSSSASSSVKVVILTMDTHLNSAAIKARNALVRQVPGLSFAIHSASEYAADAHKLTRCQADIASADIIVVSMLFLEDHFLPILPDLQARRDNCTVSIFGWILNLCNNHSCLFSMLFVKLDHF